MRLRQLYLSENQLEGQGAQAFAAYIQNIDTLETIDFAKNNIDSEGLIALLTSLEHCAKSGSLQKLVISENWIQSTAAITALVTLITFARALSSLDISDLQIEKSKQQKRIIEALVESPCAKQLTELKWNSDIKMDRVGREALESLMSRVILPKLKTIEL